MHLLIPSLFILPRIPFVLLLWNLHYHLFFLQLRRKAIIMQQCLRLLVVYLFLLIYHLTTLLVLHLSPEFICLP